MKGTEMKGIERLRGMSMAFRGYTWGASLSDALSDIADQIKREHAEDCCRMGLDYGAVSRVVTDMERHVSGAEGAEDSPVARWARELREALTSNEVEKMKRGHADDASMSAYDLLPEEERVAIAWVREHGGLAHVKDIHHDFRAVVERLGVEWSESELHGLMDVLDKRLMPEGMELLVEAWPRFEDDATLRLGERAMGFSHKSSFVVDHVTLFAGGEATVCAEADHDSGKVENFVRVFPGERVKRPTPKVLDADGVEIRERRDAWWICDGDERGIHAERLRVETIRQDGLVECSPYNGGTWVRLEPSELYVNKPVPASDGKPLREGETVWVTRDSPCDAPLARGDEVTVRFAPQATLVHVEDRTGSVWYVGPNDLTHEPPDSWERLEDDATIDPHAYCVGNGLFGAQDEHDPAFPASELMARDLVRRAKALAGGA